MVVDGYGHLGESSVCVTTVDKDGYILQEIVDVDVEEKRKRDDLEQGRRVRFRHDSTPRPTPTATPFVPIPPVPTPAQPAQPASTHEPPASSGQPSEQSSERTPRASQEKYRLTSNFREEISVDEIDERIMATTIPFSLKELFATSSDISSWAIDAIRKRRKLVDAAPISSSAAESAQETTIPPLLPVSTADVCSVATKPLYACPSGRVNVTLEGHLHIRGLIDSGSEVNLIPLKVYEMMDPQPPIDTDIRWRISSFNAGKESEASGCIGVCHRMRVDIGGVEVALPVFIVEHTAHDLMLGRPWERLVRAQYMNEDDGSLTAKIKSIDGRRVVQFVAMKANDERNREFAREEEGKSIDGMNLKF